MGEGSFVTQGGGVFRHAWRRGRCSSERDDRRQGRRTRRPMRSFGRPVALCFHGVAFTRLEEGLLVSSSIRVTDSGDSDCFILFRCYFFARLEEGVVGQQLAQDAADRPAGEAWDEARTRALARLASSSIASRVPYLSSRAGGEARDEAHARARVRLPGSMYWMLYSKAFNTNAASFQLLLVSVSFHGPALVRRLGFVFGSTY